MSEISVEPQTPLQNSPPIQIPEAPQLTNKVFTISQGSQDSQSGGRRRRRRQPHHPPKDDLGSLVNLIDDIKDKIPEQKYKNIIDKISKINLAKPTMYNVSLIFPILNNDYNDSDEEDDCDCHNSSNKYTLFEYKFIEKLHQDDTHLGQHLKEGKRINVSLGIIPRYFGETVFRNVINLISNHNIDIMVKIEPYLF